MCVCYRSGIFATAKDTRFQVPGYWFLLPDSWLLAPGSQFPLTRDPRHAINPLAKSAKSLKLLLQAATAKWQ